MFQIPILHGSGVDVNSATVCDGGVTTDMSTQVIIGLLQVVVFLFVVWWAWASIQ